jgi:hypothetical protein
MYYSDGHKPGRHFPPNYPLDTGCMLVECHRSSARQIPQAGSFQDVLDTYPA